MSYPTQDTAQQGASAPNFCTNSTMGALVKGVGKPGCNLLPFVTAFTSLTSNHNVLCHGGHSQSISPARAHPAVGLYHMFTRTGRGKEMSAVTPWLRCGAIHPGDELPGIGLPGGSQQLNPALP